MKLRYTPQARADLQAIRAYIAKALANPQAAERAAKRVLQSCQRLKTHPQLGPALAAKLGVETDLRYLVSGNYLVFTGWRQSMFLFSAFWMAVPTICGRCFVMIFKGKAPFPAGEGALLVPNVRL